MEKEPDKEKQIIDSPMIERHKRNLANPEKIKHYVDIYEKRIKKFLFLSYGQDNLTNIEMARLRIIAEEVVRQNLEEVILCLQDQYRSENLMEVDSEILFRWFWELYDIKPQDIPKENGRVPEDFKEYLRRVRSEAHLI